MKKNKNQVYNTAIYVRLSKEDGNLSSGGKSESNSISNQRELIENHLKQLENIKIIGEYVDDGFSGTSFERPGFSKMLEDIKEGLVNCVVVKDLSRFGRDYIDAGKYIEKIFPMLGVRFIAINDQYDSLKEQSNANGLIVPFKNLINDAYARDISIKVRSHLEIKRKRGEFIGSFAPYGYKKAKNNKNQLVIDEEAASVIRRIYHLKLQGYNSDYIAEKLNTLGIPSPLEYRIKHGVNLKTTFATKGKSQWCPLAIIRILENEVYTGTLLQGKSCTPNYKVKQVVYKDKKDWVRVENTHEPIISVEEYKTMQGLLKMDTRTSPNHSKLHLFSGIVECADCGGSMIRKVVPAGNKKYYYLLCSTYKNKKKCASHQISEPALEKVVYEVIAAYVKKMTDIDAVFDRVSASLLRSQIGKQYEKQIKVKGHEIEKYEKLKMSLYEDLVDKVLSKSEYTNMKKEFSNRIEDLKTEIDGLEQEASTGVEIDDKKLAWLQNFKKYKSIDKLNRTILIELVDKILIHDKEHIEIKFRNQDYYEAMLALYKEVR